MTVGNVAGASRVAPFFFHKAKDRAPMCLFIKSRSPLQRKIEAFKLLAVPCDRSIVVSPFCVNYRWSVGRNEARDSTLPYRSGLITITPWSWDPFSTGIKGIINEGVIHACLRHRGLFRSMADQLNVKRRTLAVDNPKGLYFGIARVQIYPQDFVAWGFNDEIAAKAVYLSEREYGKLLVGRARHEKRIGLAGCGRERIT